MPIILSRANAAAVKLDPAPFRGEGELQSYIAQNPECIPMGEIEEGLELLVLGREFPTASGPVDVLAMDSSGLLYLIETKLYANPDKRKVVAQVLDYGASLWAAGAESTSASLDDFLARQPDRTRLSDRVQARFGLSDDETSETVDELWRGLRAGRFRFIVLMDQLHDRLKDLILFLNENSNFQLLAVELECYEHQDTRITIPRLFGAELKGGGGLRKSQRWDEALMRSDLDARGMAPEHRALIEWACGFARTLEGEGIATIEFGGGNKPSMLVHGPRMLAFRISIAKNHKEASISLHMKNWKLSGADVTRVDEKLAALGATIGVPLKYEPGRLLSIVSPLLSVKDRGAAERDLRELLRVL
jgi:hypothetical protein